MNPPLRITFIGGGNMATAILSGLAQLTDWPMQCNVVDPNAEQCQRLAAQYGVSYSLSLVPANVAADVIVLAVKPQNLADIAAQIAPHLQQQLVISIAAGIGSAKLSAWLGDYQRLVRVMPNTPAQVGAGISGLFATASVDSAQRQLATRLFESVGSVLWLDDEAYMDKITAISGCGPAYVFYMIEALEAAARDLGFDAASASLLAEQTFTGAIKLLQNSTDTPTSLRAKVTSKKGVTEQGIASMEQSDLFGLISRATQSAEARSIELGKTL